MYHCGLKYYIQKELKLHKPKNIVQASHAAIIIEQKYKLHKPLYVSDDMANSYFKGKAGKPSSENTSKYVPPPLRSEGKQKFNVERKKKGNCWKCGDKYYVGHKCTTQNYITMKLNEKMNARKIAPMKRKMNKMKTRVHNQKMICHEFP